VVTDYVQSHHGHKPDHHIRLIREADAEEEGLYAFNSSPALCGALADGLTVSELQAVVDRLLRRQFKEQGAQAQLSRQLGIAIANPTEFAASLDRAQLFQALLVYTDDQIISAVDSMLSSGDLCLREYERRVAKVQRWVTSITAEIGPLGVRFTGSMRSGLVARRSLSLLHRLYFASGVLEPADLGYLLESPSVSEDELLGHSVQRLSPEQILRDLVVADRRAAVEAADHFGIESASGMPRDELCEKLLWKLGVPSQVVFRDLERVLTFETELSLANSRNASSDTIRGHISNLFAALEDALQRALEFATWALTTDHMLDDEAFVYDPEPNPGALSFIETSSPTNDHELQLRLDGKNTIEPLAAGFARLCKYLRNLSPEDYKRDREQFPHECRVTSRPFELESKLMFFNLSRAGGDTLLSDMQAVGQYAQDQVVVKMRNASIHGNNAFPTMSEIDGAVERIRLCRERLRASGLYPRVYRLVNRDSDAFGRVSSTYRSGAEDIVLFVPQWSVAPRLPTRRSQLIVMPTAGMLSSGPLRFALEPKGPRDPYWDGWPRRWTTIRQYAETNSRQHATTDNPFTPEGVGPSVAV